MPNTGTKVRYYTAKLTGCDSIAKEKVTDANGRAHHASGGYMSDKQAQYCYEKKK